MINWRHRLCELGSLLVFQGILAQDAALHRAGEEAIRELLSLGFSSPSSSDIIRIFPHDPTTPGIHAAAWRPGNIILRLNPKSSWSREVYLRHELFHEFSYRSCKGQLRGWEHEAGAMAFSGEAASNIAPLSETGIERLRMKIALDRQLDELDYETLRQLVALHGWPIAPCSRNPRLVGLLGSSHSLEQLPFSYEVVSVLSGRRLLYFNSDKIPAPPGSLLKLPYAAALKEVDDSAVAKSLASSDTEWLGKQMGKLDQGVLISLLGSPKWQRLVSQAYAVKGGSDAGVSRAQQIEILLGERDAGREFPLVLTLRELGWLLRNSILTLNATRIRFDRSVIANQGTLHAAPESFKSLISELQAVAKTGTASTVDGRPLVGHLVVSWPVDNPLYLAVFRQGGVRGASLAAKADELLRRVRETVEVRGKEVRVLLKRTSDLQPHPIDTCQRLAVPSNSQVDEEFATNCAQWQFKVGNNNEMFSGNLLRTDEGWILRTDAESFADGVLRGEADRLIGTPREALRAVAMFNGSRGPHWHGKMKSVCDTSHCMVFRGVETTTSAQDELTEVALLEWLESMVQDEHTSHARMGDWLLFSQGGGEIWERSIPAGQLNVLLEEPVILNLLRVRQRDGSVGFEIDYETGRETVSCELIRRKLKLPSCPQRVQFETDRNSWRFSGQGLGHGRGLDVGWLNEAELARKPALEILQSAFSGKKHDFEDRF